LIKNEITPIQNTESEPLISKVNTKYRIWTIDFKGKYKI
jgi:hypothetical protein